MVIERVAFTALLLGLPSIGLAMGSLVAPPRSVLPVKVVSFCAGLFLSCLLLLGTVWGTASSAEVLPIDTSVADSLGRIAWLMMSAALVVGMTATAVSWYKVSHKGASGLS